MKINTDNKKAVANTKSGGINKNKNMSERLYCINESVYASHITKRRDYEVLYRKDGQVRIKNDNQKLVWLSLVCFAKAEIPAIGTIKIDDPINDPENDCVEVTIEFTNGERRWTSTV